MTRAEYYYKAIDKLTDAMKSCAAARNALQNDKARQSVAFLAGEFTDKEAERLASLESLRGYAYGEARAIGGGL
ncbi:MAG: hypothetical protein II610_04105 [Treponema sp.]|nr:hypothetical protein [Treponema sp.]